MNANSNQANQLNVNEIADDSKEVQVKSQLSTQKSNYFQLGCFHLAKLNYIHKYLGKNDKLIYLNILIISLSLIIDNTCIVLIN